MVAFSPVIILHCSILGEARSYTDTSQGHIFSLVQRSAHYHNSVCPIVGMCFISMHILIADSCTGSSSYHAA